MDEHVGRLRQQLLVVVDPAPADGDREEPAGLRGADVEGRVTDIRGVRGLGAQPRERLEAEEPDAIVSSPEELLAVL